MPDTLLSDTVSEPVLDDRRRPSRIAVKKALIPMLRYPAGNGEHPSERHAARDAERSHDMIESVFPRNLGRSILVSLGLWGVILAGLVAALR